MKVILTIQDVIMLVREEYQLPDDVQVEIEGFVEVNTYGTAADGWIDVPSDWRAQCAPSTANGCYKIEVCLRDGTVTRGQPDDWNISWVQENNPRDIVKFRKVA